METILVIDDEPSILSFLKTVLERENYHVLVATNGKDGKEKVSNYAKEIHVVITDLIMPEADGMEVISWLKTNYDDIKVIAMSGGARTAPESYLSLANMIGADLVLQKPFDKQTLLTAVEKVLK